MNKIYQYRPAFFTGFYQEIVVFNTARELFAIPFVKNFSDDEDFYRFSLTEDGHYLFAEYWKKIKHKWMCVGWFDIDNDPELASLSRIVI